MSRCAPPSLSLLPPPTCTCPAKAACVSPRVALVLAQAEGEDLDFRGLLHRDGTVFSSIRGSDLQQPEVRGVAESMCQLCSSLRHPCTDSEWEAGTAKLRGHFGL